MQQPDERVRMWADRLERHITELEAWAGSGDLLAADIIDRLDALRHDMNDAVA